MNHCPCGTLLAGTAYAIGNGQDSGKGASEPYGCGAFAFYEGEVMVQAIAGR